MRRFTHKGKPAGDDNGFLFSLVNEKRVLQECTPNSDFRTSEIRVGFHPNIELDDIVVVRSVPGDMKIPPTEIIIKGEALDHLRGLCRMLDEAEREKP